MSRPVYRVAVVVNDRRARIAFALLLLGAVCIALAPIFVRLSAVGAVPTAFWRVALAVPCLAATIPLLPHEVGRMRTPSRWAHVAGFALAGILFAGDMTAFNFSVNFTSVANATLLPNTAPIFVALYSLILFGTRFTRQFVIGMGVTLIGAFVVMGNSLEIGGGQFIGDLLGIVAAMFYGAYFIVIARLRWQFSTAVVITLSAAFTALCMIPVMAVAGGPWLPDRIDGWLVLVALAVISQSLGQGLITFAFAYLPPAFGAVTLLIQPVLSALFAWVLLGEALGMIQSAGIAIVLFGIVLARQGTLRGSGA